MAARQLLLFVTLITWAVAAHGKAPVCQTYVSFGQLKPASGTVSDAIFVPDAFNAESASVRMDVSHRRVGALQITLTAQSFGSYQGQPDASEQSKSIVLKAQGLGRLGQDLYHTTFSDLAPDAFPQQKEGAPFTGSYRPTQRLQFLVEGNNTVAGVGGSQGVWVLRFDDLAPNATRREIFLNGWTLTLCEPEIPDDPAPAPSPQPLPPSSPAPTPEPAPAPLQESSSPTATDPTPQPSPPVTTDPQPSPFVPPYIPPPTTDPQPIDTQPISSQPSPSPLPSPPPAPVLPAASPAAVPTPPPATTGPASPPARSTPPSPRSPVPPSPSPKPAVQGNRFTFFGIPVVMRTQQPSSQQQQQVSSFQGPQEQPKAAKPSPAGSSHDSRDSQELEVQEVPAVPGVLSGVGLRQRTEAWMRQTFGAFCTDLSCSNVRQGMWRLVVAGLYTHALYEGGDAMKQQGVQAMTKLMDLLPGDNPTLAKAIQWVEAHKPQLQKLGERVLALLQQAGVTVPPELASFLTRPAPTSTTPPLGPLASFLTGDGNWGNNAGVLFMQQNPLAGLATSFLRRDGNRANNAFPSLLSDMMGLSGGAAGMPSFMSGLGDLQALFGQMGASEMGGTNPLEALFGGGGGSGGRSGLAEAAPFPGEALFASEDMQNLMKSFLGQDFGAGGAASGAAEAAAGVQGASAGAAVGGSQPGLGADADALQALFQSLFQDAGSQEQQ